MYSRSNHNHEISVSDHSRTGRCKQQRWYQDMDVYSVVLLTLAEWDSTDPPARAACLCPPYDPFGNAEIQELLRRILLIFIIRKVGVALIFLLCPSFTCTRTLMQTQPCCVRVFSHWPQVCEYREDLCARLPLPLLLCFWTPLLSKDWPPGLIFLRSSSHKHFL